VAFSEIRGDLAVTVREVSEQDEAAFTELAGKSLGLHRPWIHAPTTSEDFRKYLARLDGVSSAGYLVCDGATGDIAGFINLNEIVRGPYQRGLLGYGVFEPYAGQGYMKHGLLKVIELAFGTLELHRLEADIQPGNERSVGLVRKLGFQREGLSKEFICIDGKWMDHERLALIKER
jgi:ribosomal-protein-alanine N-acetyltransferase